MLRHMHPLVYECKGRKKGKKPAREGRRDHVTFTEGIADWVNATFALEWSESDPNRYACSDEYAAAVLGERNLLHTSNRSAQEEESLLKLKTERRKLFKAWFYHRPENPPVVLFMDNGNEVEEILAVNEEKMWVLSDSRPFKATSVITRTPFVKSRT